jgi:hypothetical protein
VDKIGKIERLASDIERFDFVYVSKKDLIQIANSIRWIKIVSVCLGNLTCH